MIVFTHTQGDEPLLKRSLYPDHMRTRPDQTLRPRTKAFHGAMNQAFADNLSHLRGLIIRQLSTHMLSIPKPSNTPVFVALFNQTKMKGGSTWLAVALPLN